MRPRTPTAGFPKKVTESLEDAIFYPLGDSAIVVKLGSEIDLETHRRVRDAYTKLAAKPPVAMIEVVPAFTTLTVTYDPLKQNYLRFKADIEGILLNSREMGAVASRVVEIPVCYGYELGPDLEFVAAEHGLTTEDVIRIHCGAEYTVYMVGFVPGFPYLGGMSERIATPRRASPRDRVPPRSVAIGGKQTGIYPIESPGGWQIIGRTPVELFLPENPQPSLLQMGDTVLFRSISRGNYEELADTSD